MTYIYEWENTVTVPMMIYKEMKEKVEDFDNLFNEKIKEERKNIVEQEKRLNEKKEMLASTWTVVEKRNSFGNSLFSNSYSPSYYEHITITNNKELKETKKNLEQFINLNIFMWFINALLLVVHIIYLIAN